MAGEVQVPCGLSRVQGLMVSEGHSCNELVTQHSVRRATPELLLFTFFWKLLGV